MRFSFLPLICYLGLSGLTLAASGRPTTQPGGLAENVAGALGGFLQTIMVTAVPVKEALQAILKMLQDEELRNNVREIRQDVLSVLEQDVQKVIASLTCAIRRVGILGVVPVVGMVSATLVGFSLAKTYLVKKFFTPPLEMASPEGRIRRFINRNIWGVRPPPSYKELILPPVTKHKLHGYFKVLEGAIKRHRPLPTLLLYGPPGTGKTEIIKRYVSSHNYRFLMLSGASLSQYTEDKSLELLNQMFQYAETTSSITFILIDEAEELLAKRDGNSSETARKLFTQFLSYTGTLSSKYVLVYTTNRPNVLDEAMNRRITYQIPLEAPGPKERQAILQLYLKRYVFSDEMLTIAPQELFNPSFMSYIVDMTQGRSGADLQEVAMRIQNEAPLNNDVVNQALVEDILKDMLAKHKKKHDYVNQESLPAVAAEVH